MRIIHAIAALAAFTPALFTTAPAMAQAAWPTKTVTIVVPYPGGGGIDVLGRVWAQKLQSKWGQAIVIENKAGANTIIGAQAVAAAEPDGHTLFLTTDATFTINPHLYGDKLPYKTSDFQPVILAVYFSQMMVAHPSLPANNLAELIALAKAQPGKLNYASYGSGSQSHLATEGLKAAAGVDILHVPYRGLQPAMTAALANEVNFTWVGVASGQANVKAGRLKAIAIGGEQRAKQLPDVPTFKELGYPTVDSNAWFGLFAPAKTPGVIVEKIHADISAVMADAEMQAKEVDAKGYNWSGAGPEAFADHIAKELAARKELVRISGAKAE